MIDNVSRSIRMELERFFFGFVSYLGDNGPDQDFPFMQTRSFVVLGGPMPMICVSVQDFR